MDSSTIHVARGNVEAWHGLILTTKIISDPIDISAMKCGNLVIPTSALQRMGFCNNCCHSSPFFCFCSTTAAHPRDPDQFLFRNYQRSHQSLMKRCGMGAHPLGWGEPTVEKVEVCRIHSEFHPCGWVAFLFRAAWPRFQSLLQQGLGLCGEQTGTKKGPRHSPNFRPRNWPR